MIGPPSPQIPARRVHERESGRLTVITRPHRASAASAFREFSCNGWPDCGFHDIWRLRLRSLRSFHFRLPVRRLLLLIAPVRTRTAAMRAFSLPMRQQRDVAIINYEGWGDAPPPRPGRRGVETAAGIGALCVVAVAALLAGRTFASGSRPSSPAGPATGGPGQPGAGTSACGNKSFRVSRPATRTQRPVCSAECGSRAR